MPAASASSSTRSVKIEGGLDGLQRRVDAARKRGGYHVKVGLPVGSAPYTDGTSVIMVGTVHEFGEPDLGIPERSFLRAAMADNADYILSLARDLAQAVTSGKRSPTFALETLGTEAAALVQDTIRELQDPPLKAATARRKGSTNPLIDSGHLIQSITHEVVG